MVVLPRNERCLVPKTIRRPKAAAMPWAKAHEGVAPGGVFEHGALEEDDPATWEAPVPPEVGVGDCEGEPERSRDGDRGVGELNSSGEAGERVTPDPVERKQLASR